MVVRWGLLETLSCSIKKPLKTLQGAFQPPDMIGVMNFLLLYEAWLRGEDLNLRPLGYEPNELPDYSTPLYMCGIIGSRPFEVKRIANRLQFASLTGC